MLAPTIRVLSVALLCGIAALAQQPNQPVATLRINGVDGPPYPILNVGVPRNAPSSAFLSGAPASPFVVFGANNILGPTGLTYLGGIVDLELSSLGVVLDGISFPTLFSTNSSGTWLTSFVVPATAVLNDVRVFQSVLVDPNSPAGIAFTAATQVIVVPGITTQNLTMGDDTAFNFSLSPYGLTMPYYTQTYSSFFVNSNGSISFDFGTTDFTATPTEMLAQMPRIAGTWTDLSPNVGGVVSVAIDQTVSSLPIVDVNFVNVPEFGIGPSHTFTMRLFTSVGDIQLINPAQNPPGNFESLAGISPGGGLSSAPPVDLSAMNTAPLVGATNQAIYEWFGLTSFPNFTLPASNPWDLTSTTLTFSALNAGTPTAAYFATAFP